MIVEFPFPVKSPIDAFSLSALSLCVHFNLSQFEAVVHEVVNYIIKALAQCWWSSWDVCFSALWQWDQNRTVCRRKFRTGCIFISLSKAINSGVGGKMFIWLEFFFFHSKVTLGNSRRIVKNGEECLVFCYEFCSIG